VKITSRNRSRANRIANALKTVKEYDGALDYKASITDALSDLRHLCDKLDLDFAQCDRSAYDHYSMERAANLI
jgi:hypothetical protein